ncbi:MAG: acyl-CoA dehydrogenase family protein [Propionibacteriaceae bacterium]|nr:acyl-CoA dehydrogenase family protein [Propionibacteriaceae bacterium]
MQGLEAYCDTDERRAIRDAVKQICDKYDDEYWRDKEKTGTFPFEFANAIAESGWLGIAMPEEFGGAGLGITEACIMMQTVANSAGAQAAASSIHINIFGPHAMVVHGTEEQKARWIPDMISGKTRACFGVTEPDAGLNTTQISTRAVKQGDKYIVNGRKMWISTAQQADKIMLLTRTTPIEECARPTDGLSIFFTDFNRDHIEAREIEKMGRHAVNSNALFIDDLPIPAEDLIGEEGQGFYYLLDSLNPERMLVAAEAIGLGRRAVRKAAEYASEREVFGRQIGKNQAIQHPLAENWSELYAAEMLMLQAARLYDSGQKCGLEANAAKYLAADAAFNAADRAVRTHGGMGYSAEYNVERYFRESVIQRIGPVSREMILCFIAERALDLPKSY